MNLYFGKIKIIISINMAKCGTITSRESETMERFKVNCEHGLTKEQVKIRNDQKLVNIDVSVPTKSIGQIVRNNLFTLFNLLNLLLAIAVFCVSSYKNLFFMGIVLCNTAISTFQEIRSKKVVDKLSIIASNKANVIREGKLIKIPFDEVVLDDIIYFQPGNQVIADSIIQEGTVEVNESFITGESELVSYKEGDMLKSGSFIVIGTCKAQVEHIGLDNYTHVISKDAKYVKPINSILMNSLNKIIKLVSIIIVPMGLLLFYNQYNLAGNTVNQAVLNTVAALIGMIPEGLVLLTSTVLAVSVIRLSRLNVLVQELYCIEMLARVDTICLDKTGTITDGNMEVVKVIPLSNAYDLSNILGNFVFRMDAENATMAAMKKHFKACDNLKVIGKKPFSSVYKYCSVCFEKEGTFVLGAPEFVYAKDIPEVKKAEEEYRTLLLCHSDQMIEEQLPKDLVPIACITLKDHIRETAKKTFEYFKQQGVNIKIISGDNEKTVSNIAARAGLDAVKGIDVHLLPDDKLEDAILNYNVFGRVTPMQKKTMVEILQKHDHFVAMTGDGVNDVLALKQADCSIAVAEGADAARNVSQLVLLDSDFDALPVVVGEGRRTINNIERSATLFLAKTCYATLLAMLFIFLPFHYPFQPIQLTLTNFFTIGVPSFILALEPNHDRIKGNFLLQVFSKALPTALTIVLNIVMVAILGHVWNLGEEQISTLCVIMTGFTGFLLLIKLCMPFTKLRLGLLILLITGFIISVVGLRTFFSLTLLNPKMLILMGILVFLSMLLFQWMSKFVNYIMGKYPKIFS